MERAANREKNQPLCMAQYYRLLGSCRRPGDPRDSQYLPEPRDEQHVIVCCRNQVRTVHTRAYNTLNGICREYNLHLISSVLDVLCSRDDH